MKILRRILVGLIILFGVLVLVLVGSIAVDALLGRSRLEQVTNLTIPGQAGSPAVAAYAAAPPAPDHIRR
jgi:hypothetical protein